MAVDLRNPMTMALALGKVILARSPEHQRQLDAIKREAIKELAKLMERKALALEQRKAKLG